MSEKIYYLLYYGHSQDGMGSPQLISVTENEGEAKKHIKKIDKARPYGFGYVALANETGVIDRWS